MKKAYLALILAIPLITSGQYDYGFLQESFFGRQPSARAEALGKGYASIDGDLAAIFYNPAGTFTLKGVELNASFSSPYYILSEAKYSFLGVGGNINKYLTVAVSRNHFEAGGEIMPITPGGSPVAGGGGPTNSFYTLNLSSQPVRNLFIGLNVNYLEWSLSNRSGNSTYLDLGIIKKLDFCQQGTRHHTVNFGAGITNMTFASVKLETGYGKDEMELPVVNRFAVNYQFSLYSSVSDSLSILSLLWQGEYQLLLNSKYLDGFHTGAELMILEIFSLRIGYYTEKQYDYDMPSDNRDEIHSLTCGFGIQMPLHKMTRIPLKFSFDCTSLPQVDYTRKPMDWDSFSSYTFRLNWIMP